MVQHPQEDDADFAGSLILAAEDCSPEEFQQLHRFSTFEDKLIRSLIAHGPVLLRGGRGSGKSALMIEAARRLREKHPNVLGVYLSLRNLPLLRSKGEDYEKKFCGLLIPAVREALHEHGLDSVEFDPEPDVGSIQRSLSDLALRLRRRLVLLFDDAAHLGRETSLTEFFDIYRTISSRTVSCKAAIYPGVTKFGIRFDVYNDATVLDVARDERNPEFGQFFLDVMEARYPGLSSRLGTRSTIRPKYLARILGRTVVGNMRAFTTACNQLHNEQRIGYPEITRVLTHLASSYYWPLLDELEPKLGLYAPLIDPSGQVADVIFRLAAKTVGCGSIIIHRDLCHKYAKPLEILEYAGFLSRREASRAMKSGGRGPRFILNLANLLEVTTGSRLAADLAETWLEENIEPAEIHVASNALTVTLPKLAENAELEILKLPIAKLKQSPAYPYGLTENLVDKLVGAGHNTVGDLAEASEADLDDIEYIGEKKVKRIKNVVYQAIWM